MLHHPRFGTWLLALVVLPGACGGRDLTREALQQARSRWESQPVPSYSLEASVTLSGATVRRVRVEVRDGEIVAAVMTEAGAEHSVEGEVARPYTVEGLFRTLAEEIAAGKRRFVRARFDASFGFPERIELGPLRGAPVADVWVLRVESFHVVSGD